MEKSQVQAGAKVKFLEADLFAGFSKKGEKNILLVKQLNVGDQETEISVKDIAESIAKTIKKISEGLKPEDADPEVSDNEKPSPVVWPSGIGELLDEIKVKISQVYLYISSEGEDENRKVEVEYAIGIGINLKQEDKEKISKQPPFDLIQLEELFLKIWHTKNDKILKEMNIIDFEKEFLALEEKPALQIPYKST